MEYFPSIFFLQHLTLAQVLMRSKAWSDLSLSGKRSPGFLDEDEQRMQIKLGTGKPARDAAVSHRNK